MTSPRKTSKAIRTNPLALADFGDPEAEADRHLLETCFYESSAWQTLITFPDTSIIVGRKGAGKSALTIRLEIESVEDGTSFIRLTPSEFRHVELRQLLEKLVYQDTTWQYVYQIVWRGLLIGQIVRFLMHWSEAPQSKISLELLEQCKFFNVGYNFYTQNISDALVEIVSGLLKKDGELKSQNPQQLSILRKQLEPSNQRKIIECLNADLSAGLISPITVCVDGLDDNWDSALPSMHFLAVLLPIAKKLRSEMRNNVRIIICLRDNILRALIDSKSIEIDKIESMIVRCEWNSNSLFELIVSRAFPELATDQALATFLRIFPNQIDGLSAKDYLARYLINRPRDYINFFKLLQKQVASYSEVAEVHVQEAINVYCAGRLLDLESEFAHTYPGITKVIESFAALSTEFDLSSLISHLNVVCRNSDIRDAAKELFYYYGEPHTLAMTLISIGAIGFWQPDEKGYLFIHEFSQSRVAKFMHESEKFCLHPTFAYALGKLSSADVSKTIIPPVRIVSESEYVPAEKDTSNILTISQNNSARRSQLLSNIIAIQTGQAHFRYFEKWVKQAFELCFYDDLNEPIEQIAVEGMRFECIFEIKDSTAAPWNEITSTYKTFRVLVECKNTEAPSNEDYDKLGRDMDALNLNVAFLAYRGEKREPNKEVILQLRGRYAHWRREKVIIGITDAFLRQILAKDDGQLRRRDLSKLWRSYLEQWLVPPTAARK